MGLRAMGLVVAAGLLLGACGDDNKGGGSGSSSASGGGGGGATTVKVSETEFKLAPANPKVDKAGVVQFKVKNDGKIVHGLEVEGPSGEAKTAAIQPGKSAALKVNLSKAGSYEWYCPIDGHKQQGMKGKITVAGGGSGGSTTSDGSGGGNSNGY